MTDKQFPLPLDADQLKRCTRLKEKYYLGQFGGDDKALERALRQAMAEGVMFERAAATKTKLELEPISGPQLTYPTLTPNGVKEKTRGEQEIMRKAKLTTEQLAIEDLQLRVAALEKRAR